MASSKSELRYLALAAGAAWLLIVHLPVQPLQTVAGLALTLYLPGRAMLAGLLKRPTTRMEAAALAFGLSLCVAVLGGFALHFLEGLTTFGWATFLAAFTVGACLLVRLFATLPETGRADPPMWRRLRLRDRASLATAAFFCLLSFTIASAGLQRYPFFHYTELWIVPEPGNVRNGVNLGVRSREASGQGFVMELHTADRMLARWATIHLEPDETWTRSMPLSADALAASRLEVRLYKAEDTRRLYRRAWLGSFK